MTIDNILMQDNFDSLGLGPLKEVVDDPFREMHGQPAYPQDNLGGWSRRVSYWTMPADQMWSLVETEEGRRLQSNLTAAVYDNVSLANADASEPPLPPDAHRLFVGDVQRLASRAFCKDESVADMRGERDYAIRIRL